jgi:DNA-directed RNA polymerase subunit RPC12/RpoP
MRIRGNQGVTPWMCCDCLFETTQFTIDEFMKLPKTDSLTRYLFYALKTGDELLYKREYAKQVKNLREKWEKDFKKQNHRCPDCNHRVKIEWEEMDIFGNHRSFQIVCDNHGVLGPGVDSSIPERYIFSGEPKRDEYLRNRYAARRADPEEAMRLLDKYFASEERRR